MDHSFTDRHWPTADGLTLHFREYGAASAARPPIVCLHGLTRNARDFESLAPHLAAQGWHVLVPSMRGRGDSDYADSPDSYALPTYLADLGALLAQENIERFVSIGTSMGGLMTMLLAQAQPGIIAGAVLNDIGPVLETAGLDTIKSYVGQGRSFPTWMHAGRALEETHGSAFPDFDIQQWIAMAKRTMALSSSGRIVFDYDMKLAEPILAAPEAAAPADLWPSFAALAHAPLLLLRGELSTLLSPATFAEMQRRAPAAQSAVIPATGHAPTLDEPVARAAIDTFLEHWA